MGKTKFGVGQITKHSPKWVMPAFAIAMLLISVASFMISGDPAISNELKIRANHYLSGLTMLLSGIAPLFGVEPKAVNSPDAK